MVTTWPRKPHRPGFLAHIKFKLKAHLVCTFNCGFTLWPPKPTCQRVEGQQSDKTKSKTVKTHPYISTFVSFLTLLAWFTLKQRKETWLHVAEEPSRSPWIPPHQRSTLKKHFTSRKHMDPHAKGQSALLSFPWLLSASQEVTALPTQVSLSRSGQAAGGATAMAGHLTGLSVNTVC